MRQYGPPRSLPDAPNRGFVGGCRRHVSASSSVTAKLRIEARNLGFRRSSGFRDTTGAPTPSSGETPEDPGVLGTLVVIPTTIVKQREVRLSRRTVFPIGETQRQPVDGEETARETARFA